VEGAGIGEPFSIDKPGVERSVGELKLSEPATVQGTVSDAARKAVPGVRVLLGSRQELASGTQREVITDRLGRYRFVGVDPGEISVRLLTDDGKTAQAVDPFAVESGRTYPCDLVAPWR
jgi:hypothetical protein